MQVDRAAVLARGPDAEDGFEGRFEGDLTLKFASRKAISSAVALRPVSTTFLISPPSGRGEVLCASASVDPAATGTSDCWHAANKNRAAAAAPEIRKGIFGFTIFDFTGIS